MNRPLNPRVSREELERRWSLVRSAMEAHGIDVLLAQAHTEFLGGYVRYLTDIAAFAGVSTTVLFPRDGGTVVVGHGASADVKMSPADDGLWRGVSRVLTSPTYSSVNYSGRDEQANIVAAFTPFAGATVGVLGLQQISSSTMEAVRSIAPAVKIVDATEVIDPIRAVKSDEEQRFIRATAALQDTVMGQVIDEIKPGMKERDVSIRAQEIAMSLGSDQGFYMCGSAPLGEFALPRPLAEQHRVLAEGDMMHLLIETNGPGGYFTEIVRTVVLGKVPSRVAEEHEFALLAQRHAAKLLRHGALPAEIWESHNAFMREHGRPAETRVFCHAQGYDMVERPNISAAETLPIAAGMNIGCHPSYPHGDAFVWGCSNYLIGDDGAELLHLIGEDIFER